MSARQAISCLAVAASASLLAASCKDDKPAPPPPASASQATSASASASASAPSQIPSAAPGLSEPAAHAMIANNCLSCHTGEMLAQQRLTAAQWSKTVKKMHDWGSTVEPENIEPLAAYLASKYSPSTPPYDIPALSPGSAAESLAPQPDGPFAGGDAKRGATSYHDLCSTCHGEDGQGAALGVNLVDRPLLYQAENLARVVRAGKGRMPAFDAASVPDGQLADVLAHLRTRR